MHGIFLKRREIEEIIHKLMASSFLFFSKINNNLKAISKYANYNFTS